MTGGWRTGLSIRTKLTLVMLGVTVACLFVAAGLLARGRLAELERERLATAAIITSVTANYATASLAFGDAADAESILAELAEVPEVISAELYTAGGVPFATYGNPPPDDLRQLANPSPYERIEGEEVQVLRPIGVGDQRYGWMRLRLSATSVSDQIRAYVVTLGWMLAALLGVALLLSVWLQRWISRPILALAQRAEAIAGQDVERSGDELEVLSRGFDTMLARLDARAGEARAALGALRALVHSSPVAIFTLDRSSRVTLWNPQAEQLFGAPTERALGQPIAVLLGDDDLEARLAASRAGGRVAGLEYRWHRDGVARQLQISAGPLHEDEPVRGDVIVIAVDETERRAAKDALAEREVQLQRAQKLEAVGRLAGGVSHDFNNLLTVVMATAGYLRSRTSDERVKTGLLSIEEAASRGSALTRRLLAFAKRHQIVIEPADVRTVIEDLRRMLNSVVGESIELTTTTAGEPAVAAIDIGQLEQVVINLVLNARDAMPSGGCLRLSVEVAEPGTRDAPGPAAWVRLSVADTGAGMDEETRRRAFEPFFTTKERGTGLGLAMAADIVRDMGGAITVESALGQGARFSIWLPRLADAEQRAPAAGAESAPGGAETVLLVEDEPALRASLHAILEERGYRVLTAEDGVAALAVLQAEGPRDVDLLVTDVVMPGMSGAELAREVARLRSDLPVLFMSGYVGDVLSGLGVEEATAPLLQKPFTADALCARVRELLDRRDSHPRRVVPTRSRLGLAEQVREP